MVMRSGYIGTFVRRMRAWAIKNDIRHIDGLSSLKKIDAIRVNSIRRFKNPIHLLNLLFNMTNEGG